MTEPSRLDLAFSPGGPLSPSAAFWRDVACRFLERLCPTPDGNAVDPPDDAETTAWLAGAPPMPGAEYLTAAQHVVHKFVCRGTAEEKIEEKSKLAGDVPGGGTETLLTEMSDKDLMRLEAGAAATGMKAKLDDALEEPLRLTKRRESQPADVKMTRR